jgi:hypothetical protein
MSCTSDRRPKPQGGKDIKKLLFSVSAGKPKEIQVLATTFTYQPFERLSNMNSNFKPTHIRLNQDLKIGDLSTFLHSKAPKKSDTLFTGKSDSGTF